MQICMHPLAYVSITDYKNVLLLYCICSRVKTTLAPSRHIAVANWQLARTTDNLVTCPRLEPAHIAPPPALVKGGVRCPPSTGNHHDALGVLDRLAGENDAPGATELSWLGEEAPMATET